jgi:hypothetical protein
MEDNNVEKEKENSEKFLIEKDINNEEEESNSIFDEKSGRISVYIRIRPFTSFEEKIDKTSPFKLIDTENNLIQCNSKIIKLILIFL